MPTPSKPVLVLQTEQRSHRTKQELNVRKEAEDSLVSGSAMKEWPEVKKNPSAHKEFTRLQKLLRNIEKDDALYQGVINRYSLLKAECEEFEEKRERFYESLAKLDEQIPEDAKMMEYYRTLAAMQGQVIACDKQIMAKRKMMLDIEKENIMTIASALRIVPKTLPSKKSQQAQSRMEALRNRRPGGG